MLAIKKIVDGSIFLNNTWAVITKFEFIFLYGKKWNEPLKKGRQYSTVILNHKPKIYTGFFGRVFVSIIEWYRKKQN